VKRFKNILVYVPEGVSEDSALTRASEVAAANGATLTLMDVLPHANDNGGSSFFPTSLSGNGNTFETPDKRKSSLERLANSLTAQPQKTETLATTGRPFLEIIGQVLRNDHDLVVMAADSLEGARFITFGTTSMHLMRKCPCPVWVIKPSKRPRFQNVMAAIDAGDENPQGRELNRKVLQLASSIARNEQCALHITYAWQFQGSDAENMRSEISETMRNEIFERNQNYHREKVLQALSDIDLGAITPEIHVPKGNPGLLIPEIAADQSIDLIVMGTVSRTGIAGLLIGNAAELVLRQVRCSVLTAKPDGFQSPVKADR